MWKIDNPRTDKGELGWKKGLIAVVALVILFFSTIFLALYIVRCLCGVYDIEEGFFRCAGVIGIWFILYSVLGLILKKVE